MQDRQDSEGVARRGGLSRLERVLMGAAMAVGAACVVLSFFGTQDSVTAITGLLGS